MLVDLSMGATYIPAMGILSNSIDALSVIPVVSTLLGPVVGLAAAKAAISHFSVMVKDLSQASLSSQHLPNVANS